MKKIMIIGTGAQGTAVALRLNEEEMVSEIIVAGRNRDTVDYLGENLHKARGIYLDARDRKAIVAAANGVDLIVNALPLEWTKNVLEAALEVGADYQDFAGTTSLHADWVENYRIQFEKYGPRFEAIGKLALIGTGSAPGLICVATRLAMKDLDICDTIYNIVWEGVVAKRFLPFWWSPVTALHDMSEEAYAMEDGELIRTEAFKGELRRRYDYMDEEVVFSEHCHDEPIHYFFNREKYFKGVKNAYFKYAGAGMDFAKPLAQAGLLSKEEIEARCEISPFDVVLSHIPPAPMRPDEIKDIIEEGLESDSGCMVIEAYGKKDGKDRQVQIHVNAPGLAESYERASMTAEMYLTGQGGYLFSKMMIAGEFSQKGLISSDMLTMEQAEKYFDHAKLLDITFDRVIIDGEEDETKANTWEPRLRPIGYVSSPYLNRDDDMPRQGDWTVDGEKSVITILDEYADGMDGITLGSKLEIIFGFNQSEGYKLRTVPYRKTEETGLFMTRSPHRPNPIGITRVVVTRIQGNEIEVNGGDMLDGTPVFDIKPAIEW